MKKIEKENSIVISGESSWDYINEHILSTNYSKIFVLVDNETQKHCLQFFTENSRISTYELITIPVGEDFKTIETCLYVWEQLSQKGADRKSLLINLGGGVVTDLGGFVASTYQRGINFINIPTSLLAMVDASIGGKNGVDLGGLKNQIGIIRDAAIVIIETTFLNTLPEAHFKSGMAEVIKHGLIHSENYLNKSWEISLNEQQELKEIIWESIEIKNEIVTKDPKENGVRKTLNYGHTLGHAIESYFLEHPKKPTLLHGEAIAIGLILETYISSKVLDFSKNKLEDITRKINALFSKVTFTEENINKIIKLLIFDKKNTHGVIQFVLLESIGKPKINCTVSNNTILDAFNFYKDF